MNKSCVMCALGYVYSSPFKCKAKVSLNYNTSENTYKRFFNKLYNHDLELLNKQYTNMII